MKEQKFLPEAIYGDKKIIFTRDGSFSFYSMEYGESYKTKSLGAYSESRRKFAETGRLYEKFRNGHVRLLDICFGTGMNLAVTIEEYLRSGSDNIFHIVSVEKDESLLRLVESAAFLFPREGYLILRELLKKGRYGNISMEIYIEDAISFTERLSGKFHAVYFDPFSEKHNPEMWSWKIFLKMRELLEDDGCLMTYASNAALCERLRSLGFDVEKIKPLAGRNHPSLKAEKI